MAADEPDVQLPDVGDANPFDGPWVRSDVTLGILKRKLGGILDDEECKDTVDEVVSNAKEGLDSGAALDGVGSVDVLRLATARVWPQYAALVGSSLDKKAIEEGVVKALEFWGIALKDAIAKRIRKGNQVRAHNREHRENRSSSNQPAAQQVRFNTNASVINAGPSLAPVAPNAGEVTRPSANMFGQQDVRYLEGLVRSFFFFQPL